jgi:dihydrofolate reductase
MTARLLYISVQSLDGYVEDAEGKFDWSRPDAEVHRFINELLRPIGTYLYGRRMYETMRGWETDYGTASDPPELRDFAQVWRVADKVVYSRTLRAVSTPRSRLERSFDVEAVCGLKAQAGKDLTIGGSGLAAQALRAGLVDELHLFICPCIVGGGKPSLPADVRLDLVLVDHRRFEGSGMVYLRYAIRA